MFDKITTEQYNNKKYLKLHGEDARTIPTMNLFTVKTDDMDGNLKCANSRTITLGNLEHKSWN